MSDPQAAPEGLPLSLALLKWLVIGLTASMIGGVIAVVWLLVTRLPLPQAPPAWPETLALPAGITAQAVTRGRGWVAVVTTDDRLLIFDLDGQLRREIAIPLPPAD